MASIREQLLQNVVAALDGSGKPSGLTVHRFRLRPITEDVLPALVVYPAPIPEAEAVTRGDGPHGYKARRRYRVRVECRCSTDASTPPDQAIDPYVSWVVQALMADPTRGGLAHNTQETAVGWDAAEVEGATLCAAAVDVTIDYVTAAGDPDSR